MSNSPSLKNEMKADAIEIETVPVQRTTSVGALVVSPELLAKLYARPNNDSLPKQFANAGPLGFLGFTISAATFGMVLMGWGGATSLTSVVGIFFFTGPVLLLLATIFEWVKGNFLSMMICGLFCVFWLSFGPLQLPTAGIAASYSATGNASEGAGSVGYNAGIALYLIALGFAILTFFIFTLKTNVVIAFIFALATSTCFTLSGAYWSVSVGQFAKATQLQHIGGALVFAVALFGWYMTFAMMAAEVGLPFTVPVGDLSRFWPHSHGDLERNEKQD